MQQGIIAAICLTLLIAYSPAAVATTQVTGLPEDREQRLVEQKLKLIESMLATAKERAGNASPDVLGMIRDLEQLVEQARYAMQATELDVVMNSLNDAIRQLGALNRSMASNKPSTDYLQSVYQEQLEGVKSFREAFEATVIEKGAGAGNIINVEEVNATVTRAESLADEGKLAEANKLLAEAYETFSIALAKLRANETVEYKLDFKTPEDEYQYDKERYRSHDMLVQMVMDQKKLSPDVVQYISDQVGKSRLFYKQAEDLAWRSEYETAIKTQEQAIKHLVRALQRTGMMVSF